MMRMLQVLSQLADSDWSSISLNTTGSSRSAAAPDSSLHVANQESLATTATRDLTDHQTPQATDLPAGTLSIRTHDLAAASSVSADAVPSSQDEPVVDRPGTMLLALTL